MRTPYGSRIISAKYHTARFACSTSRNDSGQPEEQIICFADKFFSKSKLDHEKGIEKARKSVARYGEEGGKRFDYWCELFYSLKNKLKTVALVFI